MLIKIDDTTIGTLTLKFWRDQAGPQFIGPVQPMFVCQVGSNLVEGCARFGLSPLLAMKALCEAISLDEGFKTEQGKLLLR